MLYAIDVLESLDKRNLITPLLLYHESPQVRARALTALAAAPRELASNGGPNIQRMLADEHSEVRAAAVGALAAIGDESETELVRPYLSDANPRLARHRGRGAGAQPARRRPAGRRGDAGAARRRSRPDAARRAARGGDRAAADSRSAASPACWSRCSTTRTRASPRRRCAACGERGRSEFLFVPALDLAAAQPPPEGRGARRAGRLRRGGGRRARALPARSRDEDIWVRRHIPATLARIPSRSRWTCWSRRSTARPTASCATSWCRRSSGCAASTPQLDLRDPSRSRRCSCARARATSTTCRCTTTCSRKAAPADRRAAGRGARARRSRGRATASSCCSACSTRGATSRRRAGRSSTATRAPRPSASEYLDNVLSSAFRRRLMPMLEDMPLDGTRAQGQRAAQDAPARRRRDAAAADQRRGRGGVGRGHRLRRPPSSSRALADDIEHVLAHRDVQRLARLRGRVVDAGRLPDAGRSRAARCGSSRCPRSRWPTACARIPIFARRHGRRAVPHRAHRPTGAPRAGQVALPGGQVPDRPPPPARRTGVAARRRPTARRATCGRRRRSASRKCSKAARIAGDGARPPRRRSACS